ncbi:riboflavin synthase alpha subunit [Zymomonas mobilis subsp. mobilis ZM4 = ATCC 31821]|uniref:Riboflavin synthase n=2 Tax=Zymomonas mobilis subsp. mobilis TaxID=120045 RepID=Q5NQA6_ZYMMO|nr:riboflavin synthase [Zymomonas mobilis]AAV89099.1 riboflavin synthase, alpha subunit [Zymomonas mobilis subsp. mobilis ZM4 = ATCC 31821]ACV75326.1 riboflavin synthase, alpha subunit [Zymomonas mobilis subsp. mobilis NCIMB 11163]AEH62837.1 riboflavin synthase, alpha subunit [Zymomonas mobilis subsp. mobilis ATCC 10988]ART93270.1 riboflavin synthase [Zymomonas mobilis subsp. mobilis]AVZ25440.1 riboflavin synthase alpha subunit [Zymomonas mobilis subsp. mobilis]
MFTGIVTDIGEITSVTQEGDRRIRIATEYPMDTVPTGSSIACSGVCLTVVDKGTTPRNWFEVTVSGESVSRTAPGRWEKGQKLNLERALKIGDELGGHIVTGHVDGIGKVVSITAVGDSHNFLIEAGPEVAPHIAEKGSVSLDGVSLTVNEVKDVDGKVLFSINIIPHTAEKTTLGDLKAGDFVNIEIDVLSRYLARMNALGNVAV